VDLPHQFDIAPATSMGGVFCVGVELPFLSETVLKKNKAIGSSSFISQWPGSNVSVVGNLLGTSEVSKDLTKETLAQESDSPRIRTVSKQINHIMKNQLPRGDCRPAVNWPDCEQLYPPKNGLSPQEWSSLAPLGLGDGRVFASLKLIRAALTEPVTARYLCEQCRVRDSVPQW
jgi:hypothetical protein